MLYQWSKPNYRLLVVWVCQGRGIGVILNQVLLLGIYKSYVGIHTPLTDATSNEAAWEPSRDGSLSIKNCFRRACSQF